MQGEPRGLLVAHRRPQRRPLPPRRQRPAETARAGLPQAAHTQTRTSNQASEEDEQNQINSALASWLKWLPCERHQPSRRLLSRWRTKGATKSCLKRDHAGRDLAPFGMAEARNARRVFAEVRWRNVEVRGHP